MNKLTSSLSLSLSGEYKTGEWFLCFHFLFIFSYIVELLSYFRFYITLSHSIYFYNKQLNQLFEFKAYTGFDDFFIERTLLSFSLMH